MEPITTYISMKAVAWVAGAGGAWLLAWVLKKIPNEKIAGAVEKFFHGVGKWITFGASKKSKLWNKTVEPWLIDAIDNIVGAAVRGLIAGLRSDGDA